MVGFKQLLCWCNKNFEKYYGFILIYYDIIWGMWKQWIKDPLTAIDKDAITSSIWKI